LEDDQREVGDEFSGDDFVCCTRDGVDDLGVET
jgi:hypothetical protein